MAEAKRCLECGRPLAPGATPGDYCPRCLLVLGLDPEVKRPGTTPPSDLLSGTATQDLDAYRSPSSGQIGPYRLLRKLGAGGMGEVYEAEQREPVRRKVALKLIKWGMDTRSVVARFEAERQALAMMDHPCIAKVFDAGATDQGRPYFAMELVKGVPITDYCDRHKLPTQQRLELFMQVCEGVQHAHQKGIIHRDIKPSNVLVTIQDDKPVPKIIDFGVAKATEQRLTEKTVFTELGQLVGTPEYMSPEQAEMTGLDIDTRTDVYSLGVLLYELLSGALPFEPRELRQAGYDEIRRRIREDEPAKPSTRVSSLGEAASTAASNRGTEAGALIKRLRGDLDWISMKALEKDRTRRYGSPADLAADVARHLHSEPVLAGPPSTAYKMKKFVRRHRFGVATASVIALALVLGVLGTTYGMVNARREARRAEASNLFALGREILDENPTGALAYATASLELADQPEVRQFALQALWSGPTAISHESPECALSLAFSSDGRSLAAGGWAGMHQLWRSDGSATITSRWKDMPALETGGLTTHGTDELVFVEFSEDSRYHVSSSDSSIRIWSLPEEREVRTLDLAPWWFAVRGQDLLTFTRAGEGGNLSIQRWPLDGGEPEEIGAWKRPASLDDGLGPLRVDVDRAGRWLAYGAESELFVLPLDGIDVASPRRVGHAENRIARVHFHPDGERIATFEPIGENHGVIRLWLRDGRSSGPLRSFMAPLPLFREEVAVRKRTIQFDRGGRWMAAATLLGATTLLWDLSAPPGTEPLVLGTDSSATTSLAVHPEGSWLAAAECPNVTIRPLAREYARVLGRAEDPFYSLSFDPQGQWITTASWDGTIRLWPLASGGPAGTRILFDEGVPVQGIAVSPDGERIVAELWDGRVMVIPVSGGATLELSGFTSVMAPPPAWDREGRRVAASAGQLSHDAVARVWDLETGDVKVLDAGDGRLVHAPHFLPDGMLLTGGAALRLWDLQSGESEVLLEDPVVPAVVGPHDRYVLAGLGDYSHEERVLHLYDLQERTIRQLASHGERVSWAAWHPSGRYIVSSSIDGVIRVGPVTGEEPHLLLRHDGFSKVAVSPDGNWIASAGFDGTLRLWPWPMEGRPFHALPHDQFLTRLKSLTNYRVVRDDASITGYSLDLGPFPGWEEPPTW
jgi:serine/threonine protein kinase/WD40 repeat protein